MQEEYTYKCIFYKKIFVVVLLLTNKESKRE